MPYCELATTADVDAAIAAGCHQRPAGSAADARARGLSERDDAVTALRLKPDCALYTTPLADWTAHVDLGWTAMAWVRFDGGVAAPGNVALFTVNGHNGDAVWYNANVADPRVPVLVDDATSQLGLGRWSLYSATGANAPVEQGLDDVAALVADGAWHHVAVRLETLSTLDVFVDGVFLRRFSDIVASSGAASPGGKPIGSAAALGRLPFVFGGLVDTASGHEGFDGFVAQVAYYRRAVATEEIRNVMLNFAECEYGDGLVCLRLDEGYGSNFGDSSRFGEHPGFLAQTCHEATGRWGWDAVDGTPHAKNTRADVWSVYPRKLPPAQGSAGKCHGGRTKEGEDRATVSSMRRVQNKCAN